jgi:uncharacterized protein (TIGR02391 family)
MSYSIGKKYQLKTLELGSLQQAVQKILSVYNIDPTQLHIFADFKLGDEGTESKELTLDDLAKIVSFDGKPGFTRFEFKCNESCGNFLIYMYQAYDMLNISYQFLGKLEHTIMKLVEEELSLTPAPHEEETQRINDFWDLLHPSVVGVARKRFENGHFADAVESALKALNSAVKKIYLKRTGEELDGVRLMRKAFAHEKPVIVLDDLSFETGRNIQQGYMDLFAGAMSGIRNPKAHDNIEIEELFIICLLLVYYFINLKKDHEKSNHRMHSNAHQR